MLSKLRIEKVEKFDILSGKGFLILADLFGVPFNLMKPNRKWPIRYCCLHPNKRGTPALLAPVLLTTDW